MKQPVDYVDTNIGGIGHLLTATRPIVALPHGMMQVYPVTTPGIMDRYLADKIHGFQAGPLTISATTGEGPFGRNSVASSFDHDFEVAAPHRYWVLLEDYNIQAEYSVTAHAAYFRFAFPEGLKPVLLLRLRKGSIIKTIDGARVEAEGEYEGVQGYIHLESTRLFSTQPVSDDSEGRRGETGISLIFDPADGGTVDVRVGFSLIDSHQAFENLKNEISGWSLERVVEAAEEVWNRTLSKLDVSGGTKSQITTFYTALYRSLLRMVDISENGRYRGWDGQIHRPSGHGFYVNDALWDTYRSAHPLQLLLDPKRQVDMVRSYITMYEQSSWMPTFPGYGGERPVMLGNHIAAFITDTYLKGYRDFDLEKAYEGLRKNAMEATRLPWRRGPMTELDKVYLEKGFFPALGAGQKEWISEVHSFERRQAVSVTLEHSYDDWCIAQLAKALGKEDDYSLFSSRAKNYANLFDDSIGFMAPKTADGKWVEGFDPKLGGGQGGRDYFAECNSWVYTFNVQHDPEGLMALFGGREQFTSKLDALFVEQYSVSKYDFLKQFPDATGLIGQYPQGNEPSFHIPYLYNYAGQPWKTQRRLREIMKLWYNDSPLGICGDEDGGAMSSWYVFSAMGFYPFCPGRPTYDIGSPLFDETKIALSDGGDFTISARNVSEKNKYIQSAVLNGTVLDRPYFPHSAITWGGSLILEMGPRPNREWVC